VEIKHIFMVLADAFEEEFYQILLILDIINSFMTICLQSVLERPESSSYYLNKQQMTLSIYFKSISHLNPPIEFNLISFFNHKSRITLQYLTV